MIKFQDFENYLNQFNINKEDGITLLNYFEALALIGIEYHNNTEINDFNYGEI